MLRASAHDLHRTQYQGQESWLYQRWLMKSLFETHLVYKFELDSSMLSTDNNKQSLKLKEALLWLIRCTINLLQGRVATLQALSGTGSLKIGAVFIQKFLPGTAAYVSDPTWGNHRNIFADSGVEWKNYRYYDPKTIGLDFEGMVEDLSNAPEGSVVVLHGKLLIKPNIVSYNQILSLDTCSTASFALYCSCCVLQ